MQESVKQERWKWIGGSDIGIILGISPYKTRWQLLREKARLDTPEEVSNKYIDYGNEMEGKIRDYINKITKRNFVEGKHEKEGKPIGIRCHTDGEDAMAILEIKTTSDVEGNMDIYKAQLCFYMMNTHRYNGILACYLRPDDMSTEFDKNRLYITYFVMDNFIEEGLVDKIDRAVNSFVEDLKRLLDNPFLSEEDLVPTEIVEVAQQIVAFENRLAEIKEEEKRITAEKKKLYEAMMNANVKKWETYSGFKITRVDEIPESTKEVTEFDSKAFAEEHPRLFKKFSKTKTVKKSGRAGYVLITPPKGDRE